MTEAAQQEISTSQSINNLPEAYHKGIEIDDITYLLEVEGLTITQAAKRLNCDKSNVSTHLKRNGIVPGYLKSYKQHRADVLANWQYKLLKSITTDDLKSASLSQKVIAYGVMYDKERLERGQSTENIAYADMVKVNEKIEEKLQAMREKLGIDAEESAISGDYTEMGNGQDETP